MSSFSVPHPLGIRPEGNRLLDGVLPGSSRDARAGGLGRLNIYSDVVIQNILGFLDGRSLGKCQQISKCFYVFAAEEQWRDAVFRDFKGDFRYQHSWRRTYAMCAQNISQNTPENAENSENLCANSESLPFEVPFKISGFYSDSLLQPFFCGASPIREEWKVQSKKFEEKSENVSSVEGEEEDGSLEIKKICGVSYPLEKFIKNFEERNRPCIIKNLISSWPAVQKWDREFFENSEEFKDVLFECGPVKMRFKNIFEYFKNQKDSLFPDESPLFVFDGKFLKNTSLGSDFSTPHFFDPSRDVLEVLPPPYRPLNSWILLGGEKSHSKWHVDPNCTHAWNGVVKGRKKWFFLPPGCPPFGVSPSKDGSEVSQPVSLMEWLQQYYLPTKKYYKDSFQEVICSQGEIIFVPRGWWHAVINLDDDTFAVTQNYVPKSEKSVSILKHFLKKKWRTSVSGVEGGEEVKREMFNVFEDNLKRKLPELYEMTKGDEEEVEKVEEGKKEERLEGGGGSFWDLMRSKKKKIGYVRTD